MTYEHKTPSTLRQWAGLIGLALWLAFCGCGNVTCIDAGSLNPGDRVTLNDGEAELVVVETEKNRSFRNCLVEGIGCDDPEWLMRTCNDMRKVCADAECRTDGTETWVRCGGNDIPCGLECAE